VAVLTADFERGTNGSTISTGDTGSLTAWDNVTLAGTATGKYDNTQVAHGTLASRFANTTNSESSLRWTTAFGTQTDWYGRLYLYMTSYPSGGDQNFIRSRNAGVDSLMLTFSSTSHFFYLYNVGVQLGNTTTTFSLNTWYRIEWHFVYSAGGAGSIECKIYTSLDSITPAETKTFSSLTTAASVNEIRFGNDGFTWPDGYWLDQIVANATAYPGPFPVSTTAPAISGLTAVGSTLTSSTGTWNSGGTFDYTYQWTSNGANITGATSSTYVTQARDAGRSIGCKITATGQQATNETATQASSNVITVESGASYRSIVVADNPISYWRLNDTGGTTAADEIGLQNGTYASATTVLLGQPALVSGSASAVRFQSLSNSYASLSNRAEFQLSTGTIEAWVRQFSRVSSYAGILTKQFAYGLFAKDGVLYAFDWAASTDVNAGVDLVDGRAHHVVLAFNSGVANGSRIYCDGVAVATFTYTILNQTIELDICSGGTGIQLNDAIIDEVAIYGTVLSAQQVARHYQAGTARQAGQVITHGFGNMGL